MFSEASYVHVTVNMNFVYNLTIVLYVKFRKD